MIYTVTHAKELAPALRIAEMNGYNFTERVRKVLAMAREEAARLHHEYVGTEHILLGHPEVRSSRQPFQSSASPRRDSQKIEETVQKGRRSRDRTDHPYTLAPRKYSTRYGELAI